MTRDRMETWIMWTLAVLLPGGLALLALWLSVRAAKRRGLTAAAERVSQVPHILQG